MVSRFVWNPYNCICDKISCARRPHTLYNENCVFYFVNENTLVHQSMPQQSAQSLYSPPQQYRQHTSRNIHHATMDNTTTCQNYITIKRVVTSINYMANSFLLTSWCLSNLLIRKLTMLFRSLRLKTALLNGKVSTMLFGYLCLSLW